MELITKVKNFPEAIQYHRVPPDACIRIIIDKSEKKADIDAMSLPIISHEEQKRRIEALIIVCVKKMMLKKYAKIKNENILRALLQSISGQDKRSKETS